MGILLLRFFFFNDTATTEIYTLSLHDALPISPPRRRSRPGPRELDRRAARAHEHADRHLVRDGQRRAAAVPGLRERLLARSEEHTSELQSRQYLVCRLLLEKKKQVRPQQSLTP